MFGAKKEEKANTKRFNIKHKEGSGIPLAFGSFYVIVDSSTGVNYLLVNGTAGSGGAESFAICPLLTADGKPLVSDFQQS